MEMKPCRSTSDRTVVGEFSTDSQLSKPVPFSIGSTTKFSVNGHVIEMTVSGSSSDGIQVTEAGTAFTQTSIGKPSDAFESFKEEVTGMSFLSEGAPTPTAPAPTASNSNAAGNPNAVGDPNATEGQLRAWLGKLLPTPDSGGRIEFPAFLVIQPTALLGGASEWTPQVITSLVMPLHNALPTDLQSNYPVGFEDLSTLLLASIMDQRKAWLPKPGATGTEAFVAEVNALRDTLYTFASLQDEEFSNFLSLLRFNISAEPSDLLNIPGGAPVAPLPMFPELGHIATPGGVVPFAIPLSGKSLALPTNAVRPFAAPLTARVAQEYFGLLFRQLVEGLGNIADELNRNPVQDWLDALNQQWAPPAEDSIVGTATGFIARTFLHGLRVSGQGIFAATGQQFDPGDADSVTIVQVQTADYLQLAAVDTAGLPNVTIQIDPTCKISGTLAVWYNPEGPLAAGDINQEAAVVGAPRRYGLKVGDWLTTDPTDSNAPRYRFNFLPTHLLDDLNGRSPDFNADAYFALQLAMCDETTATPGQTLSSATGQTLSSATGQSVSYKSLDELYTHFALAFELALTPAGTLDSMPVFELGALPQELREPLEGLLKNPQLLQSVTVAVLTGASSTNGQRTDITFEPAAAVLSRTNVSASEVTQDVNSSPFCATLSSSLSSPASPQEMTDFLRLVWEASVINTAGYQLYLQRQLTADPSAVRAYLIMKLDDEAFRNAAVTPPWGFINSVLLDEQQNAAYTLHLDTPLVVMPVNEPVAAKADPSGQARKVWHANLPAGYLGFDFTHTPRAADLHASGGAAAFLDGLYHLYQFRLKDPSNQPEDGWSPTLGYQTANAGADAGWVYKARVPVGGAGGNPYSMIGEPVTLEFRVLDIYGNALPQSVTWTSRPLTYTDVLLGPSHWPGLSVRWDITGAPGQQPPQLNFRLDYQPTGNLTPPPPNGTGQSHLDDARKLYQSVYRQLMDENLTLGIVTPLTFAGDAEAAEATLLAGLRQFVHSVLTKLEGMSVGDPTRVTDLLQSTISLPLDLSAFADDSPNPNDLFELYVRLTLSRKTGLNPADTANVPALGSVTAHLSAYSVTDPTLEDPSTANTASGDHSLRSFAKQLEDAFANFDGRGSLLKVAQGPPGVPGAGHPHSIWLMKWALPGTPAAKGVQINFPSPASQAQYYAPRPLSTSLLSASVMVGDPPTDVSFTKVDLDGWGQAFLEEVRLLLSPERSSFLASKYPDSFRQIMQAKYTLAQAISKQLEPVLSNNTPPTEDEMGYFAEHLFTTLNADYSTAVMVNVTAEVNRHNGIPRLQPDDPNPLFLGRIAAAAPDVNKHFTFSNTTIRVPDSAKPQPEPVNFLVSARQPEQQKRLTLSLNFVASAFDYRFEQDEELYGFIPSTWLSFAMAGATNESGDPQLTVPMSMNSQFVMPLPLRSFPGVPHLLGQMQVANSPRQLSEALEWDASFEFAKPSAAQDNLIIDFRFNDLTPAQTATSSAATSGLFTALARFWTAYPALKEKLANPAELMQLNSADIVNVATLVGDVAAEWSQLPGLAASSPTADAGSDFSIMLDGQGNISAPLGHSDITVSGSNPAYTVTKTRAEEEEEGSAFSLALLVEPGADGANSWVITLKDLMLLSHHAIRAYARTERNSTLVEGVSTNPAFVYDTPYVTFPAVLMPSTDSSTEIPFTNPTLEAAINDLFEDLTGGYTGQVQFQLMVGARSVISGSGSSPGEQLTSTLPLFISNVTGEVDAKGVITVSGQETSYQQGLLDYLRVWKASPQAEDFNPEALEVDLTVFSNLTEPPYPLARLRKIEIIVGSDPAWWTASSDTR